MTHPTKLWLIPVLLLTGCAKPIAPKCAASDFEYRRPDGTGFCAAAFTTAKESDPSPAYHALKEIPDRAQQDILANTQQISEIMKVDTKIADDYEAEIDELELLGDPRVNVILEKHLKRFIELEQAKVKITNEARPKVQP